MRDAGQDRGVGADRGARADDGRAGRTSGYCLLRGKQVVGEGRVGTDEDVVLEAHAVPQLDAALDGDPVADDDVVLDEDVVADVAVGADDAPGEHVGERPDARAVADVLALAERLRVDEGAQSSVISWAEDRRGSSAMAVGRRLLFS